LKTTTQPVQLTEKLTHHPNSLTRIQALFEELNSNNLRYCHWKSNIALEKSLSGKTDVDLLIHRKDADFFRTILSRLSYSPAKSKDGANFPSVEHYYALDEENGVIVHVHAYYQVITGQSLTKNYHLPVEDMLLENTRKEWGIELPTKSAELVIFVLRMMLKHTSVVELLLLYRYWNEVKQEIEWLLEEDPVPETMRLVQEWLPPIDLDLYFESLTALSSSSSLYRRISLGLRLRSALRPYARHTILSTMWTGLKKFTSMFYTRVSGSPRGMIPASGGAIIAFVGPEATGKSTLIKEMHKWLGEHFAVEQIHAGKPPSTLLSFLPNLVVPALRSLLPNYRSTRIEARYTYQEDEEKSDSVYPLFFAIRSALLGYDRRTLLTRAYSRAANGNIILSDRYPSSSPGATDSPQLARVSLPKDKYPIRQRLAKYENQMYKEIAPPDLVISLSVPLEIAIVRNKNRGKEEPEELLRLRHAQASSLAFDKTTVLKVNTDQPLEETLLEVKKAIWNTL
jgi:thymidylate kinase